MADPTPTAGARRMKPMTARVRKAIGSLVIVLFLLAYIGVAASIGGHMPTQWWVQLAFYLVVGTGWSLPLIPLMIWMNRGR
jgi:hypothetical protein